MVDISNIVIAALDGSPIKNGEEPTLLKLGLGSDRDIVSSDSQNIANINEGEQHE